MFSRWVVLVVVVIPLMLGGVRNEVWALPERPRPQCSGDISEITNPGLLDELGAWWRQYGQPMPGREMRLANGVTWRLHVDAPTGIAQPRITWMPDAAAMRRANRLFEAAHACEAVIGGNLALFWQVPGSVRLTYASARLASSIEVIAGRLEERDKELPAPEGNIFDLVRGEPVALEPCTYDRFGLTLNKSFQLRGLFDTCTPGAHDRFLALWRREIEAAMRLSSYRHDAGVDRGYCSIDPKIYPVRDLMFAVHLTPGGLAVRIMRLWPRSAHACTELNSPYDTVVIPWSDLEPFLKPGSWRDELLKR